ncbi:MAG: beta strand repeat-containing protein, partial [Thermoanaerobaculia bacterium]
VTFGGTLSGPQPPMTASGAGGCTVTVGPAPVCADATANEAGGPAGATTYLWSITNGTITSANNIQNIVFTAGPSGAATLHLTVTNANNCPASNSLDVPINPAPATPTITPTPATVCAGSTGNTADGPAGATTYAWTITNGTITSLTNIQTITYTAGPSGNVTLSLTVTNASGCSAASAPTDVPISAIPTLAPADGSIFNGTFNTAGFSQAFTASPAGTYTYAINPVTPPAGLGFNTSTGLLSGTPNATGTFGFTVKATNAAGCSITQSYSVKIAPNLTAKSYTDVGNTQLVGGVVAPATPSVSVVAVSNGDTSDTTITYAVTVGPTHGALTTFNSTGTFLYTPNAGNTTSDAFTYTGTSNGVSATQTATIAFSGMVWYVDNATLSGTNDGRSNTPFKTMTAVNGAATASGDFIYVAAGSGPTTGAYTMKPGQQLIGAGATLNAGGGILIIPGVAANTPTLSGTLTLSSSVVVNGLDMSTGSSRAITNFNGASYGTVTGVSVTARSVTSTTGTAVDIQGTGNTGTMTFKSVSASGGSNGIVLSNFTGGSFTVNGDGANTSVGGNASGGTISGMSGGDGGVAGSGVYLNNATNVTLRRVTINGTNTNFGIRGFQVNGFTLEYSTVGGTNGTNHNTLPDDSGEGSIYFGNSVTNGLSTQGTFTNNNISGGAWDNMHIENTTAGTTTITVKGNTLGLNGTTTGNQSLIIEARNAGTIINSVVGGPGAGEPNTFLGAPGGLANFTGQTGTTMDVQFKNNVMSNSHPNNNIGGGCLTVASQGIMTFVVDGNSMRDADGSTMTLQKASLGTSFTGRVTNNTLGVTGVLKSASKSGNGIFLSAAGAGTIGLTITGNSILNWNGNAAMFFDNTGGSYTANFTITGNTLAEPGAGSFATLALTNGGNTTSDTVNVCAVIGGAGALKNTISGAAGLADVYLGSSGQNGGHTFNLPGYVGVSNLANVQTFVTGNNTLSSGATVIAYDDNGGEGSFTGTGTSCPTP